MERRTFFKVAAGTSAAAIAVSIGLAEETDLIFSPKSESTPDPTFPDGKTLDRSFLLKNKDLLDSIAENSRHFPVIDFTYSQGEFTPSGDNRTSNLNIAGKKVDNVNLNFDEDLGILVMFMTEELITAGKPFEHEAENSPIPAFMLAYPDNELYKRGRILGSAYGYSANGKNITTGGDFNGLSVVFGADPEQFDNYNLVVILNKDLTTDLKTRAEIIPLRIRVSVDKGKPA